MNLWNYGIYIDRLALSLRGGGGGEGFKLGLNSNVERFNENHRNFSFLNICSAQS